MKKSGQNLHSMLVCLNILYTVFAIIICSIACAFTYNERRQQVVSTLDATFGKVCDEYKSIIDNYWQVYMPIYENTNEFYDVLVKFFDNDEMLTYSDKRDVYEAMKGIIARNNGLQFIGLYSPARTANYMLYSTETSLGNLNPVLEYCPELIAEENYGMRNLYHVPDQGMLDATLCVVSPAPYLKKHGLIISGYSLNSFELAMKGTFSMPASFRVRIIRNGQMIYDSYNIYDTEGYFFPDKVGEGNCRDSNVKCFFKSMNAGDNLTIAYYTVSLADLNKLGHAQTLKIILVSTAVWILSIVVQLFIVKIALKNVSIIKSGLSMMNDYTSCYKLPDNLYGEFSQIASNINEMSDRLDENIRKAYYYELKEKDARMAELQASFNPHFLYNTLEMLRSKSYANGDEETSELIAQLSALFRGLIGTRTFICLQEELAFASRYFTLLNARYGDSVEVEYDIDNDWLEQGIIRNTFQIIIENYFVHGFEDSKANKYIRISGISEGKDGICFMIEDNGRGMDEESLRRLQASLLEPLKKDEKSYGLKNLNQRIKLFYGDSYGLTVGHSTDGGLRVEIHLRKMSVDEYNPNSAHDYDSPDDKLLGRLIE